MVSPHANTGAHWDHEPGRDAFHRVPDFPFREAQEIRDGVESVPTRFMEGVAMSGVAVVENQQL
jgi:hypothetical protein